MKSSVLILMSRKMKCLLNTKKIPSQFKQTFPTELPIMIKIIIH
jgi:hypothetical protein